MKCRECPYFEIAYEPMMPWDMGMAICEKHDLKVDFADGRKLNRLTCVEDDEEWMKEKIE